MIPHETPSRKQKIIWICQILMPERGAAFLAGRVRSQLEKFQ